MPKKRKTPMVKKPQVKIQDIKPDRDPKGGMRKAGGKDSPTSEPMKW